MQRLRNNGNVQGLKKTMQGWKLCFFDQVYSVFLKVEGWNFKPSISWYHQYFPNKCKQGFYFLDKCYLCQAWEYLDLVIPVKNPEEHAHWF